jgi:hypothetical protein
MSMRKLVQAAALLAGFSATSTAVAQTATPVPAAAAAPTPAPAPAPAVAPTRPPPLPWRQTQMLVTAGMSLSVLDPSINLYANRTVDMSIALRPRWTFNRMLQMRAGLAFSYEFTNGDFTSTRNEPRFGDMNLDLWITGIPPLGGAVKFWVAPRLIFPVSVESRARTMIVTPGLVVQGAYGIEHVLGGELDIIANATFTHPLYEYTTPGVRTAPANRATCFGAGNGGGCNEQLSGLFNPANTVSWALILAQSWEHISPGVFFSMQHIFPYQGADNALLLHNNPTAVRTNTIFAAWVDWIATPWFTAEVGYQVFRNLLNADGTYGNPFYAPYQDSRFYLQTVFSLDKIYEIASGRSGGGGGVIRTRNDQSPRGRFGMF